MGAATADDAGVYRLTRNLALVQTVDFFTPIVDDPFTYGQIAAANALSDIYAMGGRPLTGLNLMGMPTDLVPPRAINAILRGGAAKALEARCTIVGGHTIRSPEPIYGLAVTGLVNPKHLLTNAGARPGDRLVLSKPLGTGIATTAIKRGLASRQLAAVAIASMKHLNTVGPFLAEQRLTRAATDITGFGLLGHAAEIARASGVGMRFSAAGLPLLAGALGYARAGLIPGGLDRNRAFLEQGGYLRYADEVEEAYRLLLHDPQTSGGLLLALPPAAAEELTRRCAAAGQGCWEVGEVVAGGMLNVEC